MARFFKAIKEQMRERETAQALLATDTASRPVLAYAEDDYSWNQLGPYLTRLMADERIPVAYVTSDPSDPRIDNHDPLMSVHVIKESLPSFLPKVDSPVFITTMPDLDSYHIKRPRHSRVTYVFHSLNSITMAYRPHAFDAYDIFFCPGPHLRNELTAYFEAIGKTEVELIDVGYPKLDGIISAFSTYEKVHPAETTVLVAPSWGTENLLASQGEATVAALAAEGYRVVIRPHPAFFETIYPEGASIVQALQRRFSGVPNVVLETSITSENSFMEADLMISDWSGAASEYALGTLRPVLSVDVPPKVNNPEWRDLGIVPFEDRIRSDIGSVAPPGDIDQLVASVATMLASSDAYEDRLRDLRERTVYNVGRAARVGGAELARLARESSGER